MSPEWHIACIKTNPEGLVFTSSKGSPLNLDNLSRRVIRPALARVGLEWHGWHAFRRGLATNLKQIGVDDKTIQAIREVVPLIRE